MGAAFWVRRFFMVLLGAALVIGLGQWLRGREFDVIVTHTLTWAPVTAIVFTAARIYQSRRKQHCAICKDTPEMRAGNAGMSGSFEENRK